MTVKAEDKGYYFSIRTPGTPERWAQYEEELDFWWNKLNDEMLSPSPDPKKYVIVVQSCMLLVLARRLSCDALRFGWCCAQWLVAVEQVGARDLGVVLLLGEHGSAIAGIVRDGTGCPCWQCAGL